MKGLMKVLGMFVLLLAVLCVVVVAARNAIAKNAVTAGVKTLTGLQMDIRSLQVGLSTSLIDIDGIQLHNPKGFHEGLMVDLPEIYVDYDLGAFLRKQVHLQEVRLHLEEFTVVRNAQGELNINTLPGVQKSQQAAQQPSKPSEAGKAPEIRIDVLALRIGKVVFKDYSKGGEPVVREFSLNINERFENITDPQALTQIIVAKALMNTTIAQLTNFNLGALQADVSNVLSGSTEMVSGLATKGIGQARTAADDLVKSGGEAVESTQKALEGVVGGFSGLFSSGADKQSGK